MQSNYNLYETASYMQRILYCIFSFRSRYKSMKMNAYKYKYTSYHFGIHHGLKPNKHKHKTKNINTNSITISNTNTNIIK